MHRFSFNRRNPLTERCARMVHSDILKVVEDVRIRQMRGGTIVTHAALMALRSAALKSKTSSSKKFSAELENNCQYLHQIRAASIPLANGIRYVTSKVHSGMDNGSNVQELKQIVSDATSTFTKNLDHSISEIAEIGARRLKDGDVIMTHSYSSSVIAILTKARDDGKRLKVFVTETRPELEGRDVARDLAAKKIDTTLIIDSAVSHFIEKSDKVLVGAEAVAANGAIVNKIGTATIAAVAHGARVRVYAAASTYKFSPETMFGELIEIEERDHKFIMDRREMRKLPNVTIRNPAFDVTPNKYISGIITEVGVLRKPFAKAIRRALQI